MSAAWRASTAVGQYASRVARREEPRSSRRAPGSSEVRSWVDSSVEGKMLTMTIPKMDAS